MDTQAIKEMTGRATVDALVHSRVLHSGMKLGLGTGSTAMPAVRRIGALLAAGTIKNIRAVPTSFQTSIECEKWDIPLFSLNSKEIGGSLDLTIDGADEVDTRGNLVKGGGGALLLEKITAYASDIYVIVVDESKMVKSLGITFPVPVEVVPEARVPVMQELRKLDVEVVLREAVRKAGPVITDRGNLLVDIRFKHPVDPEVLEDELNRIPGIVENGFFSCAYNRTLIPKVFIGKADGTLELHG